MALSILEDEKENYCIWVCGDANCYLADPNLKKYH